MGYLDRFLDPYFRPHDSQTTLFFPYGIGSRGYFISKEDEQRIRNFLQHRYLVSLVPAIGVVVIFGSYALWLLVILVPWYVIAMRRFLKGKERSDEHFSLSYLATTPATSSEISTCILFIIGAAVLVGASIWVLLKTTQKLVGLSGLLFFGLCLAFTLRQLSLTLKFQRKNGDSR